MMLRTVGFVRGLANRLAGDRLSLRVTPADVARHFGTDVSFLRVRLALENLLRRPLPFYSGERCTFCSLIVFLRQIRNGPDIQVFFSEKSRALLQDQDGHWRIDEILIDIQDTPLA